MAYFTAGKPTAGDKQFSAKHDGATYYSVSAANRSELEKKSSEIRSGLRRLLRNGRGTQQEIGRGSAAYWRIVDGKLYLNVGAPAQKRWLEDIYRKPHKGQCELAADPRQGAKRAIIVSFPSSPRTFEPPAVRGPERGIVTNSASGGCNFEDPHRLYTQRGVVRMSSLRILLTGSRPALMLRILKRASELTATLWRGCVVDAPANVHCAPLSREPRVGRRRLGNWMSKGILFLGSVAAVVTSAPAASDVPLAKELENRFQSPNNSLVRDCGWRSPA